jgi:hypothetical protein
MIALQPTATAGLCAGTHAAAAVCAVLRLSSSSHTPTYMVWWCISSSFGVWYSVVALRPRLVGCFCVHFDCAGLQLGRQRCQQTDSWHLINHRFCQKLMIALRHLAFT